MSYSDDLNGRARTKDESERVAMGKHVATATMTSERPSFGSFEHSR
jgi:hypothetical protein